MSWIKKLKSPNIPWQNATKESLGACSTHPCLWSPCFHLSHNQNPVLKWSTQNHASGNKKPEIRSYVWLGSFLTKLHLAVAQKTGSKMACPGKWKHGPQPAVCPSDRFILSHTHLPESALIEAQVNRFWEEPVLPTVTMG